MSEASSDETSRMDRHYRFQRHVYDVTRRYCLTGRLHLIADLKPLAGQSVLEIACGTAWNLTQIARRYPDARLYGIDISHNMLATAAASIERKGLSDRIRLRQGDAASFDPQAMLGRQTFDRVVISYALSMIPGWEAALRHAASLLADGGSLHVVDFGQSESLPLPLRHLLFAFLAHHTVTPRATLADQLSEIAARDPSLQAQFQRLLGGYAWYGVLRQHPTAQATVAG